MRTVAEARWERGRRCLPARRSRRWLVVAALAAAALVAALLLVRAPPAEDRGRRAGSPRPALRLAAATSTSSWSRSTRRAPTASAATASRGVATPHLDALAREGVVFDHATATVPLTFPSHSSIFTGLIPPHHGVRDNGGFFLDDAQETLAERLKAAGYATGAFVGAWVLESRWGLAQGFDDYSDRFELVEVQGRLAGDGAEDGRRGDGRRARAGSTR